MSAPGIEVAFSWARIQRLFESRVGGVSWDARSKAVSKTPNRFTNVGIGGAYSIWNEPHSKTARFGRTP
jgi:hypothetical protein